MDLKWRDFLIIAAIVFLVVWWWQRKCGCAEASVKLLKPGERMPVQSSPRMAGELRRQGFCR